MSGNTHPKTAEILAGLEDERTALRAFIVLLEDEQRTLLGTHTEELLQLADAKIQLSNKIASLTQNRLQKLPPGSQMADWLKRNAPQGLPLWEDIRQLAGKVQQLNQTNGELIQIKQRYNQQALNALFGAAQSTAGLYGADGQTSVPSGTGRTLGSG